MTYLHNTSFSSEESLQYAITMRERRRARSHIPAAAWASSDLRDWITRPGSAVLQLQTTLRGGGNARDFILDMIQLLQGTGLPVAWYLGSAADSDGGDPASISVAQVCRSLIRQVIDQYKTGTSTWTINESHFQACKSNHDWLQLFVAVLAQIPHVALVIDAHQDMTGILAAIGQLWEQMHELNITTVVKILLLTSSRSGGSLEGLPVLPARFMDGQVALQSRVISRSESPRLARAHHRIATRHPRARYSAQTAGPGEFKDTVLTFLNNSVKNINLSASR